MNVLVDAPDGDELENVARDWAQKLARKDDYFLAFKVDNSHVKVVSRVGAVVSERIVPVAAT